MNEREFEQLLHTHRRDIVKIAAGLVGHNDAEDVAQESSLALWKHHERIPPGKERDWWVIITHSRAYDHLRKLPGGLGSRGRYDNKKHAAVEFVPAEEYLRGLWASPDQARGQEIREAIARLEPHELESIILLATHGSYRDIPPNEGDWRKHYQVVQGARKKLAA